ncbi:MAG: hypothetical protein SFU86_05575 [Pirellulaceae bacterium]|nr:hypothetical protein [Pirellulaceae bacterium]
MTNQPTAELARNFGFGQFRPGQAEVIESQLAGYSAAAVFPKGGEMSLCYQLPVLLLEGLMLVVSPLFCPVSSNFHFANH